MADELGLKLTAQVDDWVKSLDRASKSADGLLKTVLELERAVKAAFAGIEAAARVGAGKAADAFVSSAKAIDEATGRIETDAKNASKALGGIAVAADKTQKSVAESAGKIGKAAGDVGKGAAAAASSASSAVANVDASFSKVAGRLKDGIFSIQTALVGLGAVRFGQEALGAASEFEAALGQVKIVAGDSGKSIQELEGFLVDLSKTTPVGLVDLTKSLGDAIGKLPKGANQAALAIDALNAAQAAARASGSSAGQVLDGIIPILNTYGKTGITAAEVTDKLFAAFDQGGATVPELSASLGQVVGIAAQFGIGIDELLGEIAVLTRSGQTASEAITNLRQAFVSTANGEEIDKVAKRLKSLGLEASLFSAQAINEKGLLGVLEEIERVGGKPILNKLFTDIQGFLGVSTLVSAGLDQVREDIDLIGKSAGKTDAAVATIAQNFDQLAGIAKNRLGAVLIDIGERIMPTVARVLGQLADYAEKNGGQIADGIGRAVEALASFGEWVVEYGPTVLKFFVAFKGVSFFSGLAKDIKSAVGELSTLNQGFAASQALGQGFAALGAEAGGAFTGGFSSKLKGLGGTLKAAFSSPGVLGAAAAAGTIGYTIGEYLMNELGDAIEHGTQRQIRGAINALDAEISGRLKAIGAKSVEEAAAIGKRIRSGEVVRGVDGKFQTLAEVGSQAPAAVDPAFKAGIAEIDAQIKDAQAGTERAARAMAEAAAKVDDVRRSLGNEAEIAKAETDHASAQAVIVAAARRVEELTKGRAALTAQYAEFTAKSEAEANAQGQTKPPPNPPTPPRNKDAANAAQKERDELERIAQDVIELYARDAAKIADLRAEQLRLTSEAATAEVEAKRAAFDAETQAREAALTDINASEEQLARYRRDRELELTKIVENHAAAMRQAADVRIAEATRAADEEAKAYAGSAEIQKQIAENLTRQIAIIDADATARTAELRISAANRVADAERDLANRTANTLQKQIQGALDQARAAFSDPGAFQPLQPGAEPAGPVAGALSGIGGIGGGAVGGAIAILPAINEVAGAGAGFFGGDVAGLREQARAKDREAAQAEARIAAGGLSDEEKAALQERADAARAEADAFRQGAEDAKGGLETFFEDLFKNIEGFFVGWLEGLPQAIDRIANEGIPAFIEAVIGNLPKIITGFVTLTPRIVFAVAKGIAFALPKAIYQGLQDAGAQIIELLTSDIGQAITNAVTTAFGVAVGALRDGINAIFAPIIAFFSGAFNAGSDAIEYIDSTIEGIPVIGSGYKAAKGVVGSVYDNTIGAIFHQGGIVNAPSNPHAAALLAAAGAPRFAAGGMVTGVDSLARRRLSQVLSGDDIPALLSPGEGVLTARGVAAAGGPQAVESMNRGNEPAQQAAQIVLSTRVGGDAALAALLTRVVSASMRSPSGSVRMAMDQVQRATRVPAFSGLT
jgi:TP901 family phage tail tape measure protein